MAKRRGTERPRGTRTLSPRGVGTLRDRLTGIRPKTFQQRPNLLEKLGGSEKGKPHSTEEGRIAGGRRKLQRLFGGATQPQPQPGRPKPGWPKKGPMQPLRAKKDRGGPVRPINIPWPKPENPVPSKKRVKKEHGGSAAQQHYLQHGYGPHKMKMAKASDKAVKGNKLTKKSFA